MTIDYGPLEYTRARGTVERLGGWIRVNLGELCKNFLGDGTNMRSQYSGHIGQHPIPACQVTPFLLLFDRDCRTQMDATSPSPDDERMEGLHILTTNKSEALRQVQEVRKDLQHRHEQRRLRREQQNVGIRRTSTGTRVKQGDLVLVKEADSALHRDCVHVKLTHD